MAIPVPRLVDLTYADFVRQSLAQLPHEDREWTNHNASDPGITFIELFAWLCETVLYRIDQIPEQSIRHFLDLTGIPQSPQENITTAVTRTLNELKKPFRAVTPRDYETLVRQCLTDLFCSDPETCEKANRKRDMPARVICVFDRNLAYGDRGAVAPGHVSLIVIPNFDADNKFTVDRSPSQLLQQLLLRHLCPKRLVTTRVHVVGPFWHSVNLSIKVVLTPDAVAESVKGRLLVNINRFFDPFTGFGGKDWKDWKGWQLGRGLYKSELFQLLEGCDGVDHVAQVDMSGTGTSASGNIVVDEYELVKLEPDPEIQAYYA